MNITATHFADATVLSIEGRFDQNSADEAKAVLVKYAAGDDREYLVIDLNGVDYISSAGLRVLMIAAKSIADRSGTVVIANPTSVVREILEISRFHLLFTLYDSVGDALSTLSADAARAYRGE